MDKEKDIIDINLKVVRPFKVAYHLARINPRTTL